HQQPTTEQLLAENALLRRVCAHSKEIIARHELFLREGDHRIKNSLQIVSSMMSLQERREPNPAAREALRVASARILAVARIHDALQLNGGKNIVDLGNLVMTMCDSLQVMAGDPRLMKIDAQVEPIEAPLTLAQPVVLAINELVMNALRHAFPEERGGAVHVSLALDGGQVRIVVADNGVGLPENYRESHGYGMKLVEMMAAKIGGALRIDSDAGTRFTILAPLALAAA
ncbi:MAG: sensor histidine kinase, partial [Caulobacterales bacterium]